MPRNIAGIVAPPGLFRLFLAYLVVVGHFTPIHLGLAAVDLFFMLSGYWIDKMWHSEYVATDRPYFNFIVSRFWRLLPIYYVALLVAVVVGATFHDVAPVAAGWTAVHNAISQTIILGYASLPLENKTLPAVWSLDVELQFYFIAPLVIAILAKHSARSWQKITLYAVAAVGFVSFLIFYTGQPRLIPQAAPLPMFLVFFLIGLQTAHIKWRPRDKHVAAGLLLAMAVIVICVAVPATRELLVSRRVHSWVSDYNGEINALIAFLLAPYAMATVQKPPSQRQSLARLDRDFGNISYEIYVFHASSELIVRHLFGNLSRHERLPIIMATGVALFPVCWLIYQYIDRPIDRLRSKWVKSRALTRRASKPAIDDGVKSLTITRAESAES